MGGYWKIDQIHLIRMSFALIKQKVISYTQHRIQWCAVGGCRLTFPNPTDNKVHSTRHRNLNRPLAIIINGC